MHPHDAMTSQQSYRAGDDMWFSRTGNPRILNTDTEFLFIRKCIIIFLLDTNATSEPVNRYVYKLNGCFWEFYTHTHTHTHVVSRPWCWLTTCVVQRSNNSTTLQSPPVSSNLHGISNSGLHCHPCSGVSNPAVADKCIVLINCRTSVVAGRVHITPTHRHWRIDTCLTDCLTTV